MPAAPIPSDEAERLAVLQFLGFDATAERPLHVGAFDRAARLVRAAFPGAEAAVTLIAENEQVVAADGCAAIGPCARMPRSEAFCAHTILADEVLWCEDARRDPRFRDNPLATARKGVRFYAGAPIKAGGRRVGALCAYERRARPYDAACATQLAELAAMVGDALELRLSHDALIAADTARREAQIERDTVLEIPVALVFLDLDLRVRRCSRQWMLAYMGPDAPSPVGRNMHDLLEGMEQFDPMFARVLSGETMRGETPFPDPTGAMRHWRYEAQPWRGPDGVIAGMSITSLDVTELVEARLAAERSEERLELALNISNTLVWESNPDTGELLVNGAVERIFGGEPDRVAMAADPFLAVCEVDRPAVREAWRRHVEEGAPYAVQFRVARTDGVELWVGATSKVRPCADGGPGRVIGVVCDVNELVRARLDAERSETRLQMALDISESVVWEIEPGRGVVVTGAVDHIFGGPPDMSAWGGDLMMGVHPDDRPAAREAWRRHVKHGEPYAMEYRIPRPDGREVWVSASAELRAPDELGASRVIGVVHDITAIKQAEMAGQRAAAEAERASRAKSAFLANMSHELRTPLNGVLGVAGALGRSGLTADQGEMVGLIETSARSLERLLSDVLDLAKIESEAFSLCPEPVDVAGLVRGIGTLFQWRARDKGLRFDCGAQEALAAPRQADETRLRQILTNLLSNAIKFTEHGRVSLSAAAGQGDEVVVEVSDTGIGFDDEAKARLFDRFEQADGSITRRYGGTGLGLAISRSLAERMGGSLDARSAPGQGSTFVLRLPLAPALQAPAMPVEPVAPVAARAAPVRVLLAEDHPVNRRVVELILAGADVQLTSVVDGAEALEALARERFDLVLMDVQMPVLDGLSATRALRAREAELGAPRTPVLALTANAGADQAAASRAAGADEHLSKPVTAERLLDAVRRLAAPEVASPSAARRAG